MRLLPTLALCACTDYAMIELAGIPADSPPPEPVDSEVPVDSVDSDPPVESSCEGFAAPEPYEASRDETCYREPEQTVGSFDPVVEWRWGQNPVQLGYDEIMSPS